MNKEIFWGYNNESEARHYWGDQLDKGTKTVKKIRVSTRGKQSRGSLGKTFFYSDGSSDNGEEIDVVTIMLENNKIRF